MLTICDIVTVSRVWSSPSTQQRTSPSRRSRLQPRRHPLMVPLPALPTRLARGHLVPAAGRQQAAPPHLPRHRHQNPMARLLLVHVRVAFSQWPALSLVCYFRLFPFRLQCIPRYLSFLLHFVRRVSKRVLSPSTTLNFGSLLIAGLYSDDMNNTKDLAYNSKDVERRCNKGKPLTDLSVMWLWPVVRTHHCCEYGRSVA